MLELREELQEAEGWNDLARAERVRTELDADRIITFPELLHTLYRREPRVILVGVELLHPATGKRELYLNPRPDERGYRFPLRDLVAICAVGDTADFNRQGKRCLGCLNPQKG